MKLLLTILAVLFLFSCHSNPNSVAVNQKDEWTIDSTTDYMVKMFECKHLEDSEKGIYIQYAQGEATYDQYQRAHDVYMKYFKDIYQPSYNRLSKHVK